MLVCAFVCAFVSAFVCSLRGLFACVLSWVEILEIEKKDTLPFCTFYLVHLHVASLASPPRARVALRRARQTDQTDSNTTATKIHTRAPTSTEFGPTLRHTASTLRVHAAESGCAPCNMAEQ